MLVCGVCAGVHDCVWKSEEVHECLRVCVLDEFSEYLLETRVNTSADFNTNPIQFFFYRIHFHWSNVLFVANKIGTIALKYKNLLTKKLLSSR